MGMKKCQIHAIAPITCFQVPIVGTTELNLTSEEIYKCLCSKAEVSEILPNGKTIRLDFSNYNRDNSIIGEPAIIKNSTPVEEIETPFKGEEPPESIETAFVTGLSTENYVPIEEIEVETTTETEEENAIDLEDTVEAVDEPVVETIEEPEVKNETTLVTETTSDTVKDYKVDSRNNNKNNNKHNKNKKNNKK